MRALGEAVEHGYHVEGSEYGHHVRVSVVGRVREPTPDRTDGSAESADGEILKCPADAWMHHDPYGNDSPPAFIVVPPSSALWQPGRDGEERSDQGDFESEPGLKALQTVYYLPDSISKRRFARTLAMVIFLLLLVRPDYCRLLRRRILQGLAFCCMSRRRNVGTALKFCHRSIQLPLATKVEARCQPSTVVSYLGISPHECFIEWIRRCADSPFSFGLLHFQDLGHKSLNFVCCLAHGVDEEEKLYDIGTLGVFGRQMRVCD